MQRRSVFQASWALVLLVMSLSVSCTSALAIAPVADRYRATDYVGAYERLQALRSEYLEKQGPLLYALDAGMLTHHGRMGTESNRHLDQAERLMRELYTESISANVASFLVNDLTRPYQGEDYEDLYLNVFKALNYIRLFDGEAALVELRRFLEKQQFLQDKYDALFDRVDRAASGSADLELPPKASLRFSSSALGNWLAMIVARDLGETGQARFSADQVRQAFAKQPGLYPFAVPSTLADDLANTTDGTKRVNVVAFTGLAPYKEEVVERFWFSRGNYVKIALPEMVGRPTRIGSVEVRLDDGRSFALEPIEDIGLIAREAFRLNRSYIESKTVMRAVVKSTGTLFIDAAASSMAAGAESSEEANRIEFFGMLLSFASRLFNEASEQADLRISHFFPDRAWAGGIDLPQGTYGARVVYRDHTGRIVGEDRLEPLTVGRRPVNLWESVSPW